MKSTVHIDVGLRGGKTVLKACFYTPPFKVLDITEDKRAETLHLMLMNSSPGVLDSDAYCMNVQLSPHTSLQLHTQSYQRIFQMKRDATQQVTINMAEGSALCYVPHPTVPHAAANFTAKTKIHLGPQCTLCWGEILTCGRNENGEQFAFSKYHSLTEIFLNRRLVVKENLMLQPALVNMTALGQLEGYTHQASLIFLHEKTDVFVCTDAIHQQLALEKDICFGLTRLPAAGLAIRLLGYKGEQLYGLLKKLAAGLMSVTAKQQGYAN